MAAEQYSYLYPNAKSYALLPVGDFHWQGRTLRHGYIYGYKAAAAVADPVSTAAPYVSGGQNSAISRQIDFNNYKIFQYNPPALSLESTMMPVDSAEDMIIGGVAPNYAPGIAKSGLVLYFDRTREVARSNAGHGSEIWRDIGVQADLFDFFKVISGGDTSMLGQYQDTTEEGGTVRAGSLNRLTGALFDAAVAGSQIMFKSFVVVFNSNLTMHVQRMTDFAFTYLQFTSDLVPTVVQLNIGLEITNMGTKSYVTQTNAPAATSTTTPPPGTLAIPAGMPPGTNMAVPV